jgi:NCAIR mutase (PurE)-related protein
MDAALVSIVGGLVPGAVIAVPTSIGYGIATGGTTALNSSLASCAPGVTVVNIDNGYGAVCAALRIIHAFAEPRAGANRADHSPCRRHQRVPSGLSE